MDSINNFIFVCSAEMKHCRIIVKSTDTVKLRKFTIDPTSGFLFLAKYDSKSRVGAGILRYSLDGQNMKSLLKEKVFYPIDLSLDVAMKKVYFLDHYFDFIQVCDYDGNNRKFLTKFTKFAKFQKSISSKVHFHRILYFENNFFVADKNISMIQASSTFKKSLSENLEAPPKMLKLFHQQIQPPSRFEICTSNNKCEQLCIPSPETPQGSSSRLVENCLCKEGYKSDNGKCKLSEARQFIMFVHDYPKTIVAVDTDGNGESLFSPIIGLKPNIAFDVDINRKQIYFTSFTSNERNTNNVIEFRSFDGATRGSLKGEFGAVQSIQYDWVGKNLYFTTETPTTRIAVVKTETGKSDSAMIRTLIDRNIIGPCSLAIDPENGLMFWNSISNRHLLGSQIEMAWMDGSSREILASRNVNGNGSVYWPVSLTYYKATKTLYWYDILSQTIESISLGDKKIRAQSKLSKVHFQSLTVVAGKIFWVNQESKAIEAVRIDNSNIENDAKVFDETPTKKSFLCHADYDSYFDHVESQFQIECPGIWFPTPSKGVCLCGDGSSKNAIGTACIKHIPFVSPSTEKAPVICGKFKFSCKTNDECIDPKFVCDGIGDCTDGTDEQEAPEGPCPGRCDFKCDGSRCLEKHQVCDDTIDCVDEADESFIQCHNATETDDYIAYDYMSCEGYLCDNGNCISFEEKCDSMDNCGDESDEMNCPSHEQSTQQPTKGPAFDDADEPNSEISSEIFTTNIEDCKAPDFYCVAISQCIPVHQLCDGISQCGDGSDEQGRCSERMCDHITDCQFFCRDAPSEKGFVCYCPQHMVLDETDGTSCIAPQVCDDFSTCSHECETLNAHKVKCRCFHGYKLKEDNFTCESLSEEHPVLLFSNRHILRGIRLNTKNTDVKSYYSMAKNLIGLDFYYDRHTHEYSVIWSDITKDKIFIGKFHNDELLNVKAIVESDLSTTEAVAIDWIGKNLYWIDSSLKQIEVATKEGLHRTTLISENISKPRSMAIDSRFGYLFWSDWEEDEPRIERATLAGESRKAIFNLKMIGGAWPNGITLDYVKKRVFFLDAKSKEIHTIDYNGENHKRILRNPEFLYHPFAITIYENNVFWTDWRLGSVIKADKFTGSNVTIFYRSSTQPFDVKVMHQNRQPWDFNGEGHGKIIISPCEKANCSHLCLLSTNNTFKCACPHMMRLNDDNNSVCEKVEEILFYITNNPEIRAIELKHPYSNAISTIYHTSQIMSPGHIAIHPRDNRIFWTDVQLREIKNVHLSTSIAPASQKIETILDASIDKIHAFAIDWLSDLMYFSQSMPELDEVEGTSPTKNSEGGHRLLVSNLNGEFLSIVLDDIDKIFSMVISTSLRKIFYVMAQYKDGSERFVIKQCNMDGSDNINLIFEDEVVESLVFDSPTNRLYFIKNNRKIFFYDLKTENTKLVNVFYGSKPANEEKDIDLFITSLEVFRNFIYFGENTTNSLRKCDKIDCSIPEMFRKNTSNVKQLKIMELSTDFSDINGCYLHQQGKERKCAHLCIPKDKSGYECKCAIGYEKDPKDSSLCIGSDDLIIYSLGYELKGIGIGNKSGNEMLTPLQRVNLISSFDVDAKRDFIYIADNERGEIMRIKRDGSERKTILASTENFDQSQNDWLGGIAVDWVAGNLYWTDQLRGLIEVSRLDGSFRRVISSQINKPSLIALDPPLGIMFYVNGENKIIRQNLDGTSLFYVTKTVGTTITDLALDIANQVIYFCELKSNKISKIEYDGNERKNLEFNNTVNPMSLDFTDGKLYWTERGVGTIKSIVVDSSEEPHVLKTAFQLRSLRIFSKTKQRGTNPCAEPKNNGCDELCLFNGTRGNCFCSHGLIDSDHKTCKGFTNDLFFSTKNSIEKIHVNSQNGSLVNLNIANSQYLQNAVAVSYDFKSKTIFYSDLRLNAIFSCSFDGHNFTKLISNQSSVEGITFNSQNNKLFWTLNGNAEIRSLDLNLWKNGTVDYENIEKSIETVLKLKKGIDKLRAIVVEPCLAMLYFSNWNSKDPAISRIYITGFGRENLITRDIFMPNALTLDHNDKKVFWADARLDKIERCDYDGRNRIILAQSAPKHPFSIAVFENFIFWTDWMLHGVLRANKYSGNDVTYLRRDVEQPMGLFVAQEPIVSSSIKLCE